MKQIFQVEKPPKPKPWQAFLAVVTATLSYSYRAYSHHEFSVGPSVALVAIFILFVGFKNQFYSLLQGLAWLVFAGSHLLILVALTFFFIFILTPFAFFKRLSGWNPMNHGYDTKLASYRQNSVPQRQDHFLNQF